MQPKRKWLIAAVLLLIVTLATTVAAQIYMQKQLDFTAGIETVGAIEIYEDENCTVVMTGYDFPKFTVKEEKTVVAWLKNTGNIATNVTWTSDFGTLQQNLGNWYYSRTEGVNDKFDHWVKDQLGEIWNPDDSGAPETMTLAKGQVEKITFVLNYVSGNFDPCSFSWTNTFEAAEA